MNPNMQSFNSNDLKSYAVLGPILLDEAIAENVATELVSTKFRLHRNKVGKERYGIRYVTNWDYYGIGQEIAEKFAKTLFMDENEQNLNGLSRDSLSNGFTNRLLYQHCENRDTLKALYDIFCHMGVIFQAEEQFWGRRLQYGRLSESFIRDSYNKLDGILHSR